MDLFDEKLNFHRILKAIVTMLIHGGPEAEPFDGEELAVILDTLPRAIQLCTDATFSLYSMPVVCF